MFNYSCGIFILDSIEKLSTDFDFLLYLINIALLFPIASDIFSGDYEYSHELLLIFSLIKGELSSSINLFIF